MFSCKWSKMAIKSINICHNIVWYVSNIKVILKQLLLLETINEIMIIIFKVVFNIRAVTQQNEGSLKGNVYFFQHPNFHLLLCHWIIEISFPCLFVLETQKDMEKIFQ